MSFVDYPFERVQYYAQYHSYWLASPSVVFSVYISYGIACIVSCCFKNRQPIHVPRFFLVAHNAIQVALSSSMVIGIVVCTFRAGYSLYGNVNFDPNRRSSSEQGVMFFIRMFTLSKYYDLVDTLFIVLMKKDQQLTFLHCSHHCLVPIAVWYGMGYSPAGDSYVPALVNSFVHLVMYSYYLLATLHISCPWKQSLTQLQLFQFGLLFVFGMNCLRLGTIAWQTTAVNTAVQVAMLALFGQFYVQKYRRSFGWSQDNARKIVKAPPPHSLKLLPPGRSTFVYPRKAFDSSLTSASS